MPMPKTQPPANTAKPRPSPAIKFWRWGAFILCLVLGVTLVRWFPAYRANLALDAYENQSAIEWLEWSEWMKNDPREIALSRVRAYRRLRKFDLVRQYLLRARNAGVSQKKLEREQWLTLAQSGQLDQLESKFSELLNDPDLDARDVCEAYVTGFLLTAQFDRALKLTVPWLADFPNDAQAYYLQGKAHATGRHYSEAEDALRQARRLAPHRADVALALAEALLKLQQPQAALPFFRDAKVDPELYEQASLGLAQAARRSNQPELAKEELQNLVEHSSHLGAAWEELGRMQLDENDIAAACVSLQKAVDLSPNSISGQQALGRALINHGESERAKPHLEFALKGAEMLEKLRKLEERCENNPSDAESRYQLAELYRKYDTPNLAIAWARSAVLLDPKHSGAQKLLQELTVTTRSD
jgi:cytochrome c-type biogenesis protein CcmH/NrfG